jgi:hypothetical protein
VTFGIHAHPFVDTADGTCETCGYVFDFGNLHLTERGEFDYDDAPIPVCPGCTHYAHDKGPCGVVVRRHPQQACNCRERAA